MDEPKKLRMGYEGKEAQAHASLGEDLWQLHSAAQKLGEFTAGRTLKDYEELEVLQAAAASMLQLMDEAAGRIAKESAEIFARLERTAELHRVVERPTREDVWRFVEESLPGLLASASVELAAWHDG